MIRHFKNIKILKKAYFFLKKSLLYRLYCYLRFFKISDCQISFSQAGQDIFVKNIIGYDGFYIEVGSGHPFYINNTLILEKIYSWKGVSFEINEKLVRLYNKHRKNKSIHSDALNIDWEGLRLKMIIPETIDYLSIDIEPPEQTFKVLKKIILSGLKPKVITFEHDEYNFGPKIKLESRRFLENHGYKIFKKDILYLEKYSFEDWYIKKNV